ncbi:DUF3298 domain-containing protein [Devosia sp. ZW T5_3]|uniref:DUF3298 domain-containing protein n=1 Tax=Devosia sp. ZW T5_3 TaxID=3378085 RepID=UPI003851A9AE
MSKTIKLLSALAMLGGLTAPAAFVLPAAAASFDCTKASTPFEHAICDRPELSAADEVLAKTFATAIGGLTKDGTEAMRAGQRVWLDYAQRVCTDTATPLTEGAYDDDSAACLLEKFKARSTVLEASRMIGGHRFYVASQYRAMPDPNEADDPDSYWKVASHELSYPLLDHDDAMAESFNGFIKQNWTALAPVNPQDDSEASSDSVDSAVIKQVLNSRITLETSTYWFGHGAAHGNGATRYLHYFVPEHRALAASDIFAGAGWEKALLALAKTGLEAEHSDWLQMPDDADLEAIIIDPARWSFEDAYGLVIQFNQYEIAPYAYGAPTVTIPWDQLEEFKADNQDVVRYGS